MRVLKSLVLAAMAPAVVLAQTARYHVTVNPAGRTFVVHAEFQVPAGRDTLAISLPAWSPGAYDIDNYARYVHGFSATTPDGRALPWDKADQDTWRIVTGGARQVNVEFRSNPDSIMLEFSAIGADFAFFNGTNLLPYPEGADLGGLTCELVVEFPAGWRVATGMTPAGAPGSYRADSYHDLVDSPFLMGRIALDSVIVDGKPIRFAVYPDSVLTPAVWDSVSDAIRRLATVQNRIFGGPPYDAYTVLLFAPYGDMSWAGGHEHRNSQFDVYASPGFATNPRTGRLGGFVRPLLSHEFFHLWNVKRIRPAEMWPYEYSRQQFTPLLWWSEGVTEYYSGVSLARSGLYSLDGFVSDVNGKIHEVEDVGEIVSAEDASLDTWISPTFVDEAQYYYPKGALLGLMLDIQIREATNNRHSLDDVMRALYANFYQRGRGFTTPDLLDLIRPWFRGVDDFYARYINGREPLPYESVLPRAGMAVRRQETKAVFVGIATGGALDGGVVVAEVTPGSLAAAVGLQAGDVLLRLGEVTTTNPQAFGPQYRARYQNSEGQPIDVVYRRGTQEITGRGVVRSRSTVAFSVSRAPNPSPAAAAILAGIVGR